MAQDDASKVFTSLMMKETHKIVKSIIPKVNLRKDAWVYRYTGSDMAEFHTRERKDDKGNIILHKYYTSFRAYNAAEAREKGWTEYLKTFHAEAYYGEEQKGE